MIDVLDYDRAGDDFDREVITSLGAITPSIDEIDSFVDLPVRIVHRQGELELELGPYSLDENDIHRLKLALRTLERIIQ